ncbi:MAG: F0F1 ATP synthase subunit alpha, partial [Nitrospinaceae bacterium]|nr:F0F1 ATP synthase subunit alpha [Nitrospinaceae bacterium]NIR53941.1 F0F1 ATP synthase subunit alpha [Nitrospinaceae bacterium]NIS84359.1 F0F1 ATP synthase subunit alpha [Nitrospinaceae bacterium]NIT81161.1 F0F1 ATP synthase subunit alpha [Nitrospinaceae bacterium]NIU43444.1 F0F1 ATP synthase subunit alpha [Nitrospinaceae bacterium]
MTPHEDSLNHLLSDAYATFEEVLDHHRPRLQAEEIGRVISIGHGIARVSGLSRVQLDELVRFAGDLMGFAFNLDAEEVGVILLGESRDVESGSEVRRT